MCTGSKSKKIATALLLSSGLLCAGIPTFADATAPQRGTQVHRKSGKKKQAEPPPPLPSGPTGRPVQQMPLDAIATVPPQVTYENNQLTIVAPNSTLADILRAVRKQISQIPAADIAPWSRACPRDRSGTAQRVAIQLRPAGISFRSIRSHACRAGRQVRPSGSHTESSCGRLSASSKPGRRSARARTCS
jgi:hypothetical protein